MGKSSNESGTGTSGLDRRFVCFVVGFFAAWSLRAGILLRVDDAIAVLWLRQCWSQGLRLALWIVPVVVYLRYVERAPVLASLGLDTWPRGTALRKGIGLMVVFLAATVAGGIGIQGLHAGPWSKIAGIAWPSVFLWNAYVSLAEEMVFRGFIFRKLRMIWTLPRAGAISSMLFVLIHVPGWLYLQGFHTGLFTLGASIFVIGCVLALLFEWTQSLWPPILLHLLNNVVSTLLH